MKLKEWAETPTLVLVGFAAHFMGWALAAPAWGWKFYTGGIGFTAAVVGMLAIAGLGRESA